MPEALHSAGMAGKVDKEDTEGMVDMAVDKEDTEGTDDIHPTHELPLPPRTHVPKE